MKIIVSKKNSKPHSKSYLASHESKDLLRFLTAGSVDDGKSTLIGRLLYDSKMLYEDQLKTFYKDSKQYGTSGVDLDFALLTDGLKAEREQGITIDTAYRYFSTGKRSFILCDSPGHEQYTKNMATGASHCDLAIVIVDATRGITTQTKRHSFIATLLGIKHVVVAINKMDLVDYKENTYEQIRRGYGAFAAKLEIKDLHFIPISALRGDNVVESSVNMPWFKGEPLLTHLEHVEIVADRNLIDLRLPVQCVLRPNATVRCFAGTISSGIVRKGDKIVVLPSGKTTSIKSIETFSGQIKEAFAPMAITITTNDEVDIGRGDVITHINNVARVGHSFDAIIVWMSESVARSGQTYSLKTSTSTVPATIADVRYKFNINDLSRIGVNSLPGKLELSQNDIGRTAIDVHRPIPFDTYSRNKKTGAFILIDQITNATVAAGMVLEQAPDKIRLEKRGLGKNITRTKSGVTSEIRAKVLGHTAHTIWLTGLSGSGKSTIANALEGRLITMGINAFVLDGDNIRHGLNRDLGFDPEDRSENIRRVAEVAKLFNDAGVLVITAFISPYKEDRVMAKETIGTARFIEVYLNTPIKDCEKRDPKRLYKKARLGKIPQFTGVNAPYEPPESPDLTLNTAVVELDKCVDTIINKLNTTLETNLQ